MTEQLVYTVLFVVTAMKTKIRLTKEEENYYFSLEPFSDLYCKFFFGFYTSNNNIRVSAFLTRGTLAKLDSSF